MQYWILLFLLAPVLLYLCSAFMEMSSRARRDDDRCISDEEFLAAVPHARPETALKVRAIVSEQLGIPEHGIHPDDRFIEDLGAD